MITWGINALNHGSSLAVFQGNELISNTFDKSDELSSETLHRAFAYGGPSKIFWYERPWVKKTRQLYAGQWEYALDVNVLPSQYLKRIGVSYAKVRYTPHHASHAAAGYYTSPFNHCAVVVLDAIGEWECASIWEGRDGKLKKVWSRNYPNSLGLFYSAFTHLLGMTPIQEEYKLQQLAEQGDYKRYYPYVKSYIDGLLHLTRNLHRGVEDWPFDITEHDKADIAAAVQKVLEEQIGLIMTTAKSITGSDNLVYMGGVAMNSRANKDVVEPMFNGIWSLPQPGDPSSSIGAVLYHRKEKIQWRGDIAKHIAIRT